MTARSASVRRLLWTWHRRLGALVAVVVLLLALTGIALNHTEALRLDERHVEAGWLLDWYGVEPPGAGFGFVAGAHRVTLLGDHLYADRRLLGEGFGALHGAVALDGLLAIAVDGDVLLLTDDLELVERLDRYSGLPPGPRGIGVTPQGGLAVRSEGGLWLADEALLSWRSVAERTDIAWATPTPPPAPLLADLRADFRARMLTWERALLDLHSGRLFGRFGPLVMDLAALFMVVLAVSGFWLWTAGRR